MAISICGEERCLRCICGAASLCCLGLLSGDALTVQRNLGKQIERVRTKSELVLRNWQAAFASSHGVKGMGRG
jgi:hypothetical protein